MPRNKKTDEIEISYVPDENEENINPPSANADLLQETGTEPDAQNKPDNMETRLKAQNEIIARVTAERDEFQDKYLRNLADMDNFRKRQKKEKEDFQRFVLSEFILHLLEIYDNFERAIRSHSSEDSTQSILSGIQMIFKQLQELLRKYRVEEVDPQGKPFNPNFHQAISREEGVDASEPTVVEVYQKGFLYHKKLLRPALVKVAVPPDNPEGNGSGEEG